MPILAGNKYCTGCEACSIACASGAITMRLNRDGFVMPVINSLRCVNCGRCEKVCPVRNSNEKTLPLACYAAYTRREELLVASSSGGIFSELATQVISHGGCVFGCVVKCGTYEIVHVKAQTLSELSAMRGSKYVQSSLNGIFRDVKLECSTGREVLFTGTPCQISGLRSYLGKRYDNLLLVGLICHGVPSPVLLKKRLQCLEKSGDRIKAFTFRSKRIEWRKFAFEVSYESGKVFYKEQSKDVFMRLFNSDVAHRLSCYNCKARAGRSGADLLLGDFWGVEYIYPDMDYGRGISAVLVYTQKGMSAFDGLDIAKRRANFSDIIRYNKNIQGDPVKTWRRHCFYPLLRIIPLGILGKCMDMTHLNFWKGLFFPIYRPFKQLLITRLAHSVKRAS